MSQRKELESRKLIQPKIVTFKDIEPRSVEWLWPYRIARGKMSILSGMPGLGKSFMTCDLAARVSTGQPFPDGEQSREPGDVLILNAEDDPHDTIRPRLDAHNADSNRVHLLEGSYVVDKEDAVNLITMKDVEMIEDSFATLPHLRLCIIDPVGSYIGGKTDAHRDNEVRSVLAPIGKLAEKHNVAVLLVAHPNKSVGGRADDSILGSRAFTGIVRNSWHLVSDHDDEDRRLLLRGKNNLGPDQPGLAFSIGGPQVSPSLQWEEGTVDISANEHFQQTPKHGDRAKKLTEAEQWLKDFLNCGRAHKSQVIKDAEDKGLSTRTIERAAQSLKVDRKRDGERGPIMWSLPDSPDDP